MSKRLMWLVIYRVAVVVLLAAIAWNVRSIKLWYGNVWVTGGSMDVSIEH